MADKPVKTSAQDNQNPVIQALLGSPNKYSVRVGKMLSVLADKHLSSTIEDLKGNLQ